MHYGYRAAWRALFVLLWLVAGTLGSLTVSSPARAQAMCTGGGAFGAVGDSISVSISTCSTFFTNTLQDRSTPRWGGLVAAMGDLVRGPANCGIGSGNTTNGCMPSPQVLATPNASYSFSTELINSGVVTITLQSVTNASAATDAMTLYTFQGAQDVRIASSNANSAFSFSFTLPTAAPSPTLTAVSPNNGPTAGGTSVTLTGTHLSDASALTFGGAAATIVSRSSTAITATTPVHAEGVVDVAVTTPGGSATYPGGFTYIGAPTLSSATPSSGPAAGGTRVTLTGANLGAATSVTFGAVVATIASNTATSVVVTAPAHAAGAVDIAITTAGGSATLPSGYTYIGEPTLSSISPATGPAAGGTRVAITGTHLTSASSVTFDGVPGVITANSATSISVTTPAHAAGAVAVTVTTAGGTASGTFTYAAPVLAATPQAGVLPDGTVGAAYSQVFQFSGGTAPYSVTVSGTPPAGLAFEAATLTLKGTPTAAASSNFILQVSDSAGVRGDFAYTLAVAQPRPVANPVSVNATAGTATAVVLNLSGGVATRVDVATQARHGIATASGTTITYTANAGFAGQDEFTYTATSAAGTSAPATVTVNVAAAVLTLSPQPGALPGSTVGAAYTQAVSASGGQGPYRYAVAGALPAGLVLSDAGISGTPTEAGSYAFTVTATDANGVQGQASYTLQSAGPMPVAISRSVQVMAGTAATVDLAEGASGGPFTAAALVDAPQPAEGQAVLSAAEGQFRMAFTAAPLATGSVIVRYTLSNAWHTSAAAAITFTIVQRPDPSKDVEVIGLVTAQAQTAQRFATTQISNFGSRLERLHDEGLRQADSFDIQVGANTIGRRDRGAMRDGDARQGSPIAQALGAVPASALPRLSAGKTDARDTRPVPGRLAFWTGGFVNLGTSDTDSIRLDRTLVGISGGADYRYSRHLVAGIGLGYGRESTDIGQHGTHTRGQAVSGAVYASYHPGAVFVDGLLGMSYLDFDSRRHVTVTGAQAEGRRTGAQVFGSLTSGYEFRGDKLLLSPYGRLQAAWTRLKGFREHGAGAFDLTYADQDLSLLAGVAGMRSEYLIPTSWGAFALNGRLEYTRSFTGRSRAAVGYADTDATPYAIDVLGLSQDAVSAQLGVEAQWRRNVAIGISYQNTYGFDQNARDHAFRIRFRTRF